MNELDTHATPERGPLGRGAPSATDTPRVAVDTAERERAAIDNVTQRLIGRYAGRYPVEQVARTTNEAHGRYDGAKVRIFVPVLVEHDVRETLEHR